MKVSLPGGVKREIAVENARIEDILMHLRINPEEVIVAKNGRIVSEYETAGNGDELKIVRIVHGG
jgi:sulfur carrier protein ThiS